MKLTFETGNSITETYGNAINAVRDHFSGKTEDSPHILISLTKSEESKKMESGTVQGDFVCSIEASESDCCNLFLNAALQHDMILRSLFGATKTICTSPQFAISKELKDRKN